MRLRKLCEDWVLRAVYAHSKSPVIVNCVCVCVCVHSVTSVISDSL